MLLALALLNSPGALTTGGRARALGRVASRARMSFTAVGSEQSRTFSVMAKLNERQTGGAGGGTSWEALKRLDESWLRLRTMRTGKEAGPLPVFVRELPYALDAVRRVLC
ncbi:hypothetical protein T492DRAFT_341641 [Pavlovales sp. CCMP2436]|nr:hypothetical protein T492DRAFT_341641 [Pavlovales sp. CCMP2436]